MHFLLWRHTSFIIVLICIVLYCIVMYYILPYLRENEKKQRVYWEALCWWGDLGP